MTTGYKDVDFMILSKLDDKSLLSFCKTDKRGKKLCENEDFWRNRTVKKYGNVEKSEKRTWKNFYLKIVYYEDIYENLNKIIMILSKGGYKNIDIINFFISKGASDWNMGMMGAAEGGHKDLVDFFISKGANDIILY